MDRFSQALEAEERARSTKRQMPRLIHASGIGSTAPVADAAGNCVLVFERCPVGSLWRVMRVAVGGVTWQTAAQGTAIAFPTSSVPMFPDAGIPLNEVAYAWAALPGMAFFGSEPSQLPVAANEQLIVLVIGGTAGQQYAAAAEIVVNPVGAT
jgi:hypothetical protein